MLQEDVFMELLVNIDVGNLDEAIRFYERAVGLRVGRRLFEGTVAEMLGASSPIYLMEKPPGSSPSAYTSQPRDYQRHWTPVHLDFIVQDLASAVERATQAGAKLEGAPQSFAWGRQAVMSDPFGNGLCFVQWAGQGYDEVA
jgi:predicted enzyme related to lactoylglutathione lyase